MGNFNQNRIRLQTLQSRKNRNLQIRQEHSTKHEERKTKRRHPLP